MNSFYNARALLSMKGGMYMEEGGAVYLIWNLVNGKRYVGQTKKTVKERFAEHARCKTSLIGKAIHKYGKKKFRYGIIKTCATREELNYWEIHFIAALKSKVPYGYNLTDGGEGIIGCPEEVQASRSAKLKGVLKSPSHCANIAVGRSGFYGKKNPQYGKTRTPEMRSKSSRTQRHYSPYQNLLAEMDKRQMSIGALSKRLGYASMSLLSDKMHCRKNFTSKDASKLEEIFGLPSEYLLKRENCPERAKTQHIKSKFQNLLKELEVHNLSYRRFAEILGISYSALSAKMRGERSFTIKDKIKLVEIFQKPLEYLLKREDSL